MMSVLQRVAVLNCLFDDFSCFAAAFFMIELILKICKLRCIYELRNF